MNSNDLCSQEKVNDIFIPIKNKFPTLKNEIEQIEFLFKNSCYNKNRLIQEIQRSNEGFSFGKSQVDFNLKIPITIWMDIIGFEFQSCLYNIIRTTNYLVVFNLQQIEKRKEKYCPSIANYTNKKYSKDRLYNFFNEKYESWIKEINTIRNEFTHNFLIKQFEGWLEMSQKTSGNRINHKGKITIYCKKYGCLDFEQFLEEKIRVLEEMIKDFFEIFERFKK